MYTQPGLHRPCHSLHIPTNVWRAQDRDTSDVIPVCSIPTLVKKKAKANRKKMLGLDRCSMYGHTYSKSMDQPSKVANPARGQLNREISRSRLRIWSRDGFGSPVPRQPAHLHTQAESGAYLRSSSRVPRRRPLLKVVQYRSALLIICNFFLENKKASLSRQSSNHFCRGQTMKMSKYLHPLHWCS